MTFEQIVAGLAINSPDAKVVRWSLNAIALLGTIQNTAESAKFALRSNEGDPEIVAAALSALAALHKGQIPESEATKAIDPATRMLAAMQTVAPKLLAKVDLAINIDTADPEILKLALIVIGLNRDIQNLLHPRHENGVIVRALGQHDDSIVRQYSVWAVIENNRLGLEHLGIQLDQISSQPANVQAKLLQLGATALKDPIERQDLIISGSNLPRVEAREGLAKGLTHTFHEGLQDVTLSWIRTEDNRRVQLLLAEHLARFSDNVSSYRDEAIALVDRDAEFRARVYLGAEGTGLYAELRRRDLDQPDLFSIDGFKQNKISLLNKQISKPLRVLFLAATPEDADLIRPDKEAMALRERLLGMKLLDEKIVIETIYATRIDQIQQELLRHTPSILHFSGHAGNGALAFENSDGYLARLPGSLLSDILRDYKNLQCLVLNACFTDDIAKACLAHVPFVIGTSDSISDLTAPCFTYMFYQSLASGRDYRNSFALGCNEVALVDQSEAKKYVLRERGS